MRRPGKKYQARIKCVYGFEVTGYQLIFESIAFMVRNADQVCQRGGAPACPGRVRERRSIFFDDDLKSEASQIRMLAQPVRDHFGFRR